MKQPCKECIIGPICETPCNKLISYVKSNAKIHTTGKPHWNLCTCREKYRFMITGRFKIYVCSNCNSYYTVR